MVNRASGGRQSASVRRQNRFTKERANRYQTVRPSCRETVRQMGIRSSLPRCQHNPAANRGAEILGEARIREKLAFSQTPSSSAAHQIRLSGIVRYHPGNLGVIRIVGDKGSPKWDGVRRKEWVHGVSEKQLGGPPNQTVWYRRLVSPSCKNQGTWIGSEQFHCTPQCGIADMQGGEDRPQGLSSWGCP